MSKAAKQSVAVFLLALVLGVLAWRLWPDGGQARRQQRNHELLRAVIQNRLADATRLLDEGADPNTQIPPSSFSEKAETYYFDVSHGVRRPADWRHLEYEPRWSLLEIAAMHRRTNMVNLLLSKGADVGYRDTDGYTALGTLDRYKDQMPPAAWKASRYLHVAALLKAAEARKARP